MQFQHVFRQLNTEQTIFYAWFEAMHTRIDIVLCHLTEEDSIRLMDGICRKTEQIQLISDRFNPQSEISRINRLAAFQPQVVSNELYSILNDCIQYNKTTFGAFDITVQSPNNYRQRIDDIILDFSSMTVFFKNKNIQVDLCGYIKGYALDIVRNMVLDWNCNNALINFGNSSVYGLGNHPNGKGWMISLPNQEKDCVTLYNQCFTNSGNTVEHQHIIRPETGQFGELEKMVSVVTENAVVGEVISTALCVCDVKYKNLICQKLGGQLF